MKWSPMIPTFFLELIPKKTRKKRMNWFYLRWPMWIKAAATWRTLWNAKRTFSLFKRKSYSSALTSNQERINYVFIKKIQNECAKESISFVVSVCGTGAIPCADWQRVSVPSSQKSSQQQQHPHETLPFAPLAVLMIVDDNNWLLACFLVTMEKVEKDRRCIERKGGTRVYIKEFRCQ